MNIQKQFINYNKSTRTQSIKYIVIHSTGNSNDTAQNNHDYFAGGNRRSSADFFVDDKDIIQIIDSDNYYSWHCGDGHGTYGINNSNSIGIEMCGTDSGNISDSTINNTIELVQYLMDRYSIDIDHVVRHYDASKKCCPSQFSANNWARWYDFKDKLRNGGTVLGKWICKDSKWWYKHDDGTYTKDRWEKINNKWYLFDSEGWMLYNWKYTEGNWYYLGENEDGSMKTGWLLQNNNWYYFYDTGAMAIGWIKYKNDWYFLQSNGVMATDWIQENGDWYLMDSNGVMYTDCEAYGYRFASNGVATKLNN
ncbi:N-acetylmuramoyl-L-alanine amidase [Clostridium sp. ZS2]|uniref:peptidoglycan recognition protein family protein n=1 Tax=Clostridium sp. ZS2 TaxID=2949988 RepID=UPI00207A4969|nr:N-acetylmuramoyl-L-alanine amidase [Clostridium sp. ZS2]